MANTTNYNWETPDDTDLVKDGAAAIRTLGSSIDTTTKALNPSTTLGDIEYRSSTANTNARLGIGTTGQILGISAGVPAWINNDQGDITEVAAGTGISVASGTGPIPTVSINTAVTADLSTAQTLTNKTLTSPVLTTPSLSTVDAKGDLIVGTADNTIDRLAVGTNGHVLTADSSVSPTGLKWAAPAASGALTLVKRASFSNVAGTTTTFDSVFSTTYKAYLVIIEYIFGATSTNDLQLQMLFSGTTRTSGYYGGTGIATYTGTNTAVANNNAAHFILSQDIGVNQNLGSAGQLQFNNVGNASNIANWNGLIANNSNSESAFVGGSVSDATTYTGFLLKASSGNVTGVVAVYGLAAA